MTTTLAQLLTDNQQNAELTLAQRRQVVAANKRQPESNIKVSHGGSAPLAVTPG